MVAHRFRSYRLAATDCYYYRQDNRLQPAGRSRGPALVCAVEEPVVFGQPPSPGSVVYWLAHGSALVRCAPEQVRPQLPPETEAAVPCLQRIRAALPVRGPVRFHDLTARGAPAIAGAEDDRDNDF